MGTCAHADWSVDELSGLAKWRDVRASEIKCMRAGAQACTHESSQRELSVSAKVTTW